MYKCTSYITARSISNDFTIHSHLTVAMYDLHRFSVTILVNVVKLTEVLIIQKKIYDEYLSTIISILTTLEK